MPGQTDRAVFTAGDQVSRDIFTNLPGGGAVLASGAFQAADPAPVEFSVPQMAQVLGIIVNVSVISGAGATVTVTIEGWDKASSTWVPLLVSAGLTATGAVLLKFGKDITAAANLAYQGPLFETLRARPVKSGTTTTLTYSIGATFS